MRAPRHIHGQLLWADSGRVEAWWKVAPTTYRYLRAQQKRDFYARLRATLTALPEDSMILSVCGRVEPAEVVSRMVEGVDLEAHEAWIDECTATLDALTEFELFEREFFLAVDITGSSRWANARASVGSAAALVGQAFGMAATPVSAAERDRRQLLADDITAVLARLLPVEPATGAELDWLCARAPRRGLGEPTLAAARAMFAASDVRCRAAFDAGVTYHEGGRRGQDKPGAYLAVEVDTGEEVEVSYQAHLVMADMPATFVFPGTEWLPAADGLPHPVDWAVRIRRTDNSTAQRKATHRQRQLMAQVDEHEGDTAGLPPALAEALRSIDTERAALAASPNEPSLEVSTIFAVWADTRGECLTRAKQLRAAYEAHEFALPRPIGGQLDLHQAMRPGGSLPRVCADYTQYLMPGDLAGAAPFAGTELGDPHGGLFGFSLDGDCPRPVLLDPAWGPKIRRGGNVVAVGDPGAGKALDIQTPIATPQGWARMGELAVGDLVFDGQGRPTAVVAVSDVMTDRRCYEVVFSDGSTLVADAKHLWVTVTEADRARDRAERRQPAQRCRGGTAAQAAHLTAELKVAAAGSMITRGELTSLLGGQHAKTRVDKWLADLSAAGHVTGPPVTMIRRGATVTVPPRPGLAYDRRLALARVLDRVQRTWKDQRPTPRDPITTEDLRVSLIARGKHNHAIPVAPALDTTEQLLPVSPYVLGCWLGDGNSGGPLITSADPEILELIRAAGYVVTGQGPPSAYHYRIAVPSTKPQPRPHPRCEACGNAFAASYQDQRYCSHRCARRLRQARRSGGPPRCAACGDVLPRGSTGRRCRGCWRDGGFTGQLRALGVLGNKHIPAAYLRAAVWQRRELLAGLLDTDGHVERGGQAVFSNTNEQLARQVHELACSLGYRATLRWRPARLYGRDCGICWQVAFSTADQVFALPRKQLRHRQVTASHQPRRTASRYIVDVRPVDSRPVRCITVANNDGLFLAGRSFIATHNSYAFKILAGGVAARGGRPVVVDRTPSGEWVRWAGTLPGHVEVITVTAGSKLCFDPLRVFEGEDAEQAALGFLQILTGVSPREGDGITLAEAVRAVARRGGQLVDVIAELRGRGEEDQVARDVARKLEHIRGARGAGLAFGDGRVPDLRAADTVVFHVPGLQLPTRDELGSEWLRSRLRDEQVFSQGLIYLVAATARHVAYSDLTRYSPLIIDEDWVLSGPEGEQLQLEVLRDGRKHNAGLWTSSQLIGDWTPDQLRLATVVLILRQDRLAAEATLRAFDLEASEEVIRQISAAESGQALLLDLRRRAGMVAISAPADPAQRAAYDTTPTGAAAEPDPDTAQLLAEPQPDLQKRP